MNKEENRERGRRNRRAGAKFELEVRRDLEAKGWIVSKWADNVDLEAQIVIPAKSNKFRSRSTGFPDFVAFQYINDKRIIWFVEVKSNGRMSREENEKAQFYIKNYVCDYFSVASKGSDGGIIITDVPHNI
jgi:hypothetical protein